MPKGEPQRTYRRGVLSVATALTEPCTPNELAEKLDMPIEKLLDRLRALFDLRLVGFVTVEMPRPVTLLFKLGMEDAVVERLAKLAGLWPPDVKAFADILRSLSSEYPKGHISRFLIMRLLRAAEGR